MYNTIKLLSHDKMYRIIITNTTEIVSSKLRAFSGSDCSKAVLTEMLTTSILFAATNDFSYKTSFNLKICRDFSTYCLIETNTIRFEYSPQFAESKSSPLSKLSLHSTLTITTGDFSGLHTSTVLAQQPSISAIFNFFSQQSEQLPAEFIVHQQSPAIGILIQPLPGATIDVTRQLSDTLVKRIHKFNDTNWQQAPEMVADIGRLLWRRKVE